MTISYITFSERMGKCSLYMSVAEFYRTSH